jgi:hypothetical protein
MIGYGLSKMSKCLKDIRISLLSILMATAFTLILVTNAYTKNVLTDEPKHYWQGSTVDMFMDIRGQQISYVAGFMDSAVFSFHYGDAPGFKWLVECMVDHPKITNPVDVTKVILGKLRTVLKDHPKIGKQPVGLLIWGELEVRCEKISPKKISTKSLSL